MLYSNHGALVPTFVLTMGMKNSLELDDRSCLGCLVWAIKNNAISDGAIAMI